MTDQQKLSLRFVGLWLAIVGVGIGFWIAVGFAIFNLLGGVTYDTE